MTNEEKYEICAEAAHELNRIWCRLQGDNSQVPWAESPDWMKQGALKGVQGALAGKTPQESHADWCKDKYDAGWVHGAVKDPEAKTHPALVPYEELSSAQKAQDRIYVNTVNTMWVALKQAER